MHARKPSINIRLDAPGKSGPGWTIIHGDFKNSNILFSKSGDVCAAVDFQYCGQSYGARDLAMLLVAGIDLCKVLYNYVQLYQRSVNVCGSVCLLFLYVFVISGRYLHYVCKYVWGLMN